MRYSVHIVGMLDGQIFRTRFDSFDGRDADLEAFEFLLQFYNNPQGALEKYKVAQEEEVG